MSPRKRRKFTAEFKAKAVELARSSGKTVGAIARDLDLTESALRNWIARAEIDDGRAPAGALTTDERSELASLRKEVRVLQEEREILKKAAAFFAKEGR